MSVPQLFEKNLVAGEKLTLEFENNEDFKKFISHLRTAKSRAETYASSLGFPLGTENLSILYTTEKLDPLTYTVSLGEKESASPPSYYKVVSVQPSSQPNT